MNADSPAAPRPSSRARWIFAAKVGVTLVLCAVIIAYADWAEVATALARADPSLTALVMALAVLSIPLTALKWQRFLAVFDLHPPFGALQRWVATGAFVNAFLPTNVGGDGYRLYASARASGSRGAALLALLSERGVGFAALLVLGTAAAAVAAADRGDAFSASFAWIGLALSVLGGATFLAVGYTRALPRLGRRLNPSGKAAKLATAADQLYRRPRLVAEGVATSFVFHLNRIVWSWVLMQALGVEMSPVGLTVAIAASTTTGLAPVSLGGLGVVDTSLIFLLQHYGAPPNAAIGAALLTRLAALPVQLLGAAFYFASSSADRGLRTATSKTQEAS